MIKTVAIVGARIALPIAIRGPRQLPGGFKWPSKQPSSVA